MMLPYMKFYPADFLGDTMHLNTTEVGAYMLLIMHYWRNGGLPDKNSELAGITRLPLRSWERMKPTLQAFFHDGWRHKRIDAEVRQLFDIKCSKSGGGFRADLTRKNRQKLAGKSNTFVVNTEQSQSSWLHERAEKTATLAGTHDVKRSLNVPNQISKITSSFTEAAREVEPEPVAAAMPLSTLRDPAEVPRVSPMNGDGSNTGLPHIPPDARLEASREWMKKYQEQRKLRTTV